jgi:hypothetical protein
MNSFPDFVPTPGSTSADLNIATYNIVQILHILDCGIVDYDVVTTVYDELSPPSSR